jgi:hypothetical protein
MAEDLSMFWTNLSLAEEEDGELEIQKIEVEGVIQRGENCVVGKLVSDRIISKETIKTTLLTWKVDANNRVLVSTFVDTNTLNSKKKFKKSTSVLASTRVDASYPYQKLKK